MKTPLLLILRWKSLIHITILELAPLPPQRFYGREIWFLFYKNYKNMFTFFPLNLIFSF
jgi:hypothetical protein